MLTVLPDSSRVEERLLMLSRQDGFTAFKTVCTLAELERDLVRAAVAAGACPPPASGEALRLILREIDAGFARPLEDLLAALAQGLCDPEQIAACAAELPPTVAERANPLAAALAGARHRLRRAGLIDAQRAVWFAVEAVERGLPLPAFVSQAREVAFEHILDWTPLRRRLAVAIAGRLAPAGGRVRIRLPYAAGRPELTDALDATLRAFEALGASPLPGAAHVEVELTDPAEGSPLQPFLARLFARDAPQAAASAAVQARSTASPWEQAREAARSCADAAARGVPLDRIAVAARSLSGGIAEDLGAALDRVSLPWRERRGRPASTAPPVRLAVDLYELLARGFPRAPLAALLCSPLARIVQPADDLKPHRIAARLRDARVRDDARDDRTAGAGGIRQRLERLSQRLRLDEDERGAAEVDRVAAACDRALAAVRTLPESASIAQHGKALLAILRHWEVPEAVHRFDRHASSAALSLAIARDVAALDALERCIAELSRGAAALGRAEARIARDEWAELLRDALADETLTARGARGAAVQLVELRELPGRFFDHLVIAGLLDGELPARAAPDPLLSDEDKRALNGALGRAVFRTPPAGLRDDPASLLPARQAEEPLHFYLGLCAARSALLVWPRADAKGREALRSPFADEAVRAAGREADAAPLAPVPPVERCRAPLDLLARAALETFADAAWRASPPLEDGRARALAHAVLRSPLAARSPWLARAAAAERERLRAFATDSAAGRFSGLLQGAALQALLPELRFDETAPLSASTLEQHATCGFKHLAHKLLGVPEVDHPVDDLRARERGDLIHRCLDAFFARMGREGRLPLRGGAQRDAELATLVQEADAAMDAFATGCHVGGGAAWEIRRRDVHKVLARLIDAEAREDSLPREFERAFGGGEGDLPLLRLPSPEGAEAVFVRGRIDRIDELPGGAQLVLDYKAGGFEGVRRKLRLETLCKPEFQLALYVAAVAQARPGVDVDAAYVSVGGARRTEPLLRKKGLDGGALLELDPAERRKLREREPPPLNLADRVWDHVGKMRSGLFPIAPLSCEYCDLPAVCRIVAPPAEEDD